MLEKTTDTLQQKIDGARALLSRETRNAVDSVSWKLIIEGMANKYNQDQLDTLETETELLLCGLLNPETYQNELEKRMFIPRVEAERLIGELNKLIFKKIQDKLIDSLTYKKEVKQNVPRETSVVKLDQRFDLLPENLQKAISQSNYQVKIYEIGQKYKLPVDQMGVLEQIVIKTILGDIHFDKLDTELKANINLPNDKINEIISDINIEIFKDIRNLLKSESKEEKGEVNEIVPLPPYKEKENKEEIPIPIPVYNNKKEETKILADSGIEMIEEKKVDQRENGSNKEQEKSILEDSGIDIIGEKLIKPTINNVIISDYSLPKMTPEKDPYKEEI